MEESERLSLADLVREDREAGRHRLPAMTLR